MPKRTSLNVLIALSILGAIGGVAYALDSFNSIERFSSGAPQQTVAALWAVMDLLVVLIGMGLALVLAVAWTGLAIAAGREESPASLPKE